MKKLIILDFKNSKLHFYNTEREIDNEYVEKTLGYKDVEWMVGNIDVFNHKGILK